MAKERLLIVTERFFPEEFLINDLVMEFKNHYDVQVLTQIPSYPFDKIYPGYRNKLFSSDYYNGIKVHRVCTKLGYKKNIVNKIIGYLIFSILTWVKAFSLSKRFDKVFFYHTGPATMAHSAYVFKRYQKTKCFIWSQDIWPDAVFASGIKETIFRKKILEIYLKRLYSNFDKVLVSCNGFSPIISRYYNKQIVHIPQWASVKEYNIEPNIITNKMQFTFLGNLGSVQNLDKVCHGFLMALKRGLRAQLNIVGDGVVFNDLKSIIKYSGSEDILLWGRHPIEQMPDFMNKANIMVISLKEDPLFSLYVPAKFQGYTAGGRPVFGILNGEVADIINENNIGYTSNPSNIEEIAEGFFKFALNINELKKMSDRSRAYYIENYDREKCIGRILSEINY